MSKNRIQKVKQWTKDHQEGLIITGTLTAVVAVYGALVVVAIKADKATAEQAAAADARIKDAVARNDYSLVPAGTGGFWIVPNEDIHTVTA